MNLREIARFVYCALSLSTVPFPTAADEYRWWPAQGKPGALVRTEMGNGFSSLHLSYEMVAQSVAGLAAKAVNEGRSDELVWVGTDNIDEVDWLARLLKRQPKLEIRGTFGLWDLVERYARKGLIKGYILYRSDESKGELNQHRPGMDSSILSFMR